MNNASISPELHDIGYKGAEETSCSEIVSGHLSAVRTSLRGKMKQALHKGVTLNELVVVMGIMGGAAALLLPAVQQARETARKISCQNNMKQIGIALHHYHDVHNAFPRSYRGAPAPFTSASWGWQTAILPYAEQNALYDSLPLEDRSPPLPSGNSSDGVSTPIATFQCPSDQKKDVNPSIEGFGYSSYPGNAGLGSTGVFNSHGNAGNIRMANMTDGTSTTFLAGERSWDIGKGATWVGAGTTNGRPLLEKLFDGVGIAALRTGPKNTLNDEKFWADFLMKGFSSKHRDGANFVFADGHVDFVSNDIDGLTYVGHGSISDGQ